MDKATARLIRDYGLWWKVSGRAATTVEGYERHLVRYITAGYVLPPVLSEAREYLGACRDAGRSTQWLHIASRSLKSVAGWWAEEEDEVNALSKLKYPKLDEPAPGIIASDDDLDRLLAVLKRDRTFRGLRDHAIVLLLADSGARRSEIARIRVEDVDHDGAVILLPRTKSSKARRIPISNRAGTALRRYERLRSAHPGVALPALFLNWRYRSALHSDSITAMFESRCAEAGVSISAHQLRRRFASVWGVSGGSDDALCSIAGWSDTRMVARYRKADREKIATLQFDTIINGRAG